MRVWWVGMREQLRVPVLVTVVNSGRYPIVNKCAFGNSMNSITACCKSTAAANLYHCGGQIFFELAVSDSAPASYHPMDVLMTWSADSSRRRLIQRTLVSGCHDIQNMFKNVACHGRQVSVACADRHFPCPLAMHASACHP
jgi:hypothetical protein